jgi:threonine synthase
LFDHHFASLKEKLSGHTVTDAETKAAIKRVKQETGYLPDPHGAVAYLGLERYLERHPGQKGIFLETAHPVKFYDVVEPVTGEKIPVPPSIETIIQRPGQSTVIEADYASLKERLLQY